MKDYLQRYLQLKNKTFLITKAFPYPTKGLVNVVADNIISSISLYSFSGQALKRFSTFGKQQVDMNGSDKGVCLLEVLDEANCKSKCDVI